MSLHTQVQTIHDHLIIVLMRCEVHLAIAPMRREVHLVTTLMQRRVNLVATSPHTRVQTIHNHPVITPMQCEVHLVAMSPHTCTCKQFMIASSPYQCNKRCISPLHHCVHTRELSVITLLIDNICVYVWSWLILVYYFA